MAFDSKSLKNDFYFFLMAVICGGFAQSLMDATFNNFLNETFHIGYLQRSIIELPRELPGLLVIFISALCFFMCNRTLAVFARFLTAIGVFLIAFFSVNFNVMLVFLFVFSMGQHLYLPLSSDIGMEFAKEGEHGKTLGRLTGLENLAAIIGSLAVILGFKYLHFSFKITFFISGCIFLLAALFTFFMKKNNPIPASTKLKFRKEYKLYYWLTVLYGTRKQIFLTFAPWVLVTVFQQKVATMATLLFIAGVIGIGFKPLLGFLIDKLGEKVIIACEGFILIFVCLGYGFSRIIFAPATALIVAFGCYIVDQLLMSVNMARATYLKKVAVTPAEVTATLTMGTSIDHLFSISTALIGGVIWNAAGKEGYKYIFLIGSFIALSSGISAFFITTKKAEKELETR